MTDDRALGSKTRPSLLARSARRIVEHLNRSEARSGAPRRPRDSWWHLQDAGLFESVPRPELEGLAASTRVLVCPRRQHLQLDEDESRVYLLTVGAAKLCRMGLLGRRMIQGVIGPGDLFGRITSGTASAGGRVEAGTDTYELEALERTEILVIPRATFAALLDRHPDLSRTVIQQMEDRERLLRRRLESLVFKDVTERVAETLVELAREHGEHCTHGMAVDIRITQQDLADLVGASRQMVNRVIRRLTLSFYLVRKGKYLCILQHERLRRLATGSGE